MQAALPLAVLNLTIFATAMFVLVALLIAMALLHRPPVRPCPNCSKWMRIDSRTCPHCRYELTIFQFRR